MKENEIYKRMERVFRKVFSNDELTLTDNITANDIEGWDSLTHMILITNIEKEFTIKFKLRELNKMRNVGDMVQIIIDKLQ
jgi:acyl carrier protein